MRKQSIFRRPHAPTLLLAAVLLLGSLTSCIGGTGAPSAPTANVAAPTQAAVVEAVPSATVATAGPEATRAATMETASVPAAPQETARVEATTTETAATSTAETETASDAETETASPAAVETASTLPSVESAIPPRRDQVQLAFEYGRSSSLARVARTEPLPDQVGSETSFWVADLADESYYPVTATLQLALEHVLMYVENGVEFDQAALERSARDFNDRIYPRNRELFGEEWTPGVDGDARVTILNARISGAGGYFWSPDEVPREADQYSNQREMFYVNIDAFPFGSEAYSAALAHEFQHMIQWRQAEAAASWFNEGMSELAMELNGFSSSGAEPAYIASPDLQLNNWDMNPALEIAHYGAGHLFLAYFYQQYQEAVDLAALVRGGAGVHLDLFAEQARAIRPEVGSFDQIFSDWIVANLLNSPELDGGRWSYTELPATVEAELFGGGELQADVAQYGADYIELAPAADHREFLFDGGDQIGVVAAEPEGTMSWWSNRGDDIASTLTGRFDLSAVESATLEFRLWHDLEENYDYGFVSVSTDEGQSWRTLPGRHTTEENPQGANYGHGYTGQSGGDEAQWVDEEIDLTPYAGRPVLIRFSLVTDARLNGPGMLVDTIRVRELGLVDDAESGDGMWEASGWARTDNELVQGWLLRLVRYAAEEPARPVAVEVVAVDEEGRARIEVEAGQRATLVVAATTRRTTERAAYTLSELSGQSPQAGTARGGARP